MISLAVLSISLVLLALLVGLLFEALYLLIVSVR